MAAYTNESFIGPPSELINISGFIQSTIDANLGLDPYTNDPEPVGPGHSDAVNIAEQCR
jgi:hypothetical protein